MGMENSQGKNLSQVGKSFLSCVILLGYQKIMGLTNVEAEVEAIMKAVDNNNSGSIDYTGSFGIKTKR